MLSVVPDGSLPGAAGMAGLAAGVRALPETLPAIVLALLTGLNAAAVGLIALAAFQLSSNAVTDRITRLIVFGSAAFGICYHAPWVRDAMSSRSPSIFTDSEEMRWAVLTHRPCVHWL